MASFRKRGVLWQVRVRRLGFPPISKSFITRKDAEVWAFEKELAIQRNELPSAASQDLKRTTLGELIRRYRETVSASKRGSEVEGYRLGFIQRHSLAQTSLKYLSASAIASFRDERMTIVSSGTVRKELSLLSHLFDVAIREWGIPLQENPVRRVTKPKNDKPRERRLEPGELEALEKVLCDEKNTLIRELVLFAIATGMRRGELLSLAWSNVDLNTKTAYLPITKNGDPRLVPLSPMALQVLRRIKDKNLGSSDLVFQLSIHQLRGAWERITRRAELEDLNFHDLRHEAVSRFFEMGLSVPEVSLISGHKDLRMLARYTHLKAEAVAKKLEMLS